jgi:hypothetical protein
MRTIKKIVSIKKPFTLILQFDNKVVKEVDLKNRILNKTKTSNSLYCQLLNFEYFKTVQLHHEWETIFWDNGLDFCPDTLYLAGKEVEQAADKKYAAPEF